MSENCSHNCGSCSANCSSRKPADFLVPPNQHSNIKKVIGVVSGKGGVGKSMVTSTLAVLTNRKGKKTAILDADITGPSIPKAFGLDGKRASATDNGILPVKSKMDISVMSINLLLEDDRQPVIWRGPVIAGVVKQFWTDTIWHDIDYMFIDCPPGTGDVPLTVFQSIPIDGIVVVSSPQELVSMIVAKAANMAEMMNVPVYGLVENMSYVKCPDCGKEIKVFGESHIDEIAEKFGYDLLARIPMDPKLTALVDKGWIEMMNNDYLETAAEILVNRTQKKL